MKLFLSPEPLPSEHGFTLIELMVTLAVLAILAAIAIPNLQGLVLRGALDASATEFRSTIARARQEAVTRNVVVSITPAATAGASPNLQWTGDFALFVNPLNVATFAAGSVGAGTDVRTAEMLSVGNFFGANKVKMLGASNSHISFLGDGRPVIRIGDVSNQSFELCVDPTIVTGENSRVFAISTAGRVSITRSTRASC